MFRRIGPTFRVCNSGRQRARRHGATAVPSFAFDLTPADLVVAPGERYALIISRKCGSRLFELDRVEFGASRIRRRTTNEPIWQPRMVRKRLHRLRFSNLDRSPIQHHPTSSSRRMLTLKALLRRTVGERRETSTIIKKNTNTEGRGIFEFDITDILSEQK